MVSNLRSNFARLANSLIIEGDKTKAIKVLDKCIEVLPEKNVPYSLLMLPVAQAYYKAGAPDKGKLILKKLVNWYSDNMQYITSLDDNYRAYYRRDMNEAVYIFSQVAELANESKDKELENTVKPLFDKYRPYYTFDQREAESAE
jgi:tetratricopeptide (TPR) repeat protein